MATKKLPFLVQPTPYETVEVGNETGGKLSIKKLGSLAPNEQKYIRELSAELPDLKRNAVRLAQRIAKEKGYSAVDVHQALIQGNTEVLSDYLEEVLEFQDQINQSASQRALILATAILRYRVDGDWTLEDTGNADLIHPDLVDAIASFALKEESGWAEPEPDAEEKELTEDDLGKS